MASLPAGEYNYYETQDTYPQEAIYNGSPRRDAGEYSSSELSRVNNLYSSIIMTHMDRQLESLTIDQISDARSQRRGTT